MLQSMGLQRVGHTLVTEQKQCLIILGIFSRILVLNIILCGGAGSIMNLCIVFLPAICIRVV